MSVGGFWLSKMVLLLAVFCWVLFVGKTSADGVGISCLATSFVACSLGADAFGFDSQKATNNKAAAIAIV
jgi:hypothetical protein